MSVLMKICSSAIGCELPRAYKNSDRLPAATNTDTQVSDMPCLLPTNSYLRTLHHSASCIVSELPTVLQQDRHPEAIAALAHLALAGRHEADSSSRIFFGRRVLPLATPCYSFGDEIMAVRW